MAHPQTSPLDRPPFFSWIFSVAETVITTQQSRVIFMALLPFQFLSSTVYMPARNIGLHNPVVSRCYCWRWWINRQASKEKGHQAAHLQALLTLADFDFVIKLCRLSLRGLQHENLHGSPQFLNFCNDHHKDCTILKMYASTSSVLEQFNMSFGQLKRPSLMPSFFSLLPKVHDN